MPSNLISPENEPLTLIMKDCRVTARAGFENERLIEGYNLKRFVLDGTKFENFSDPTIATEPVCELESTNITSVKLTNNKEAPKEGV